ncbi:MAG: RNA-binding cell elongation regulator Jag/EloR [Armatimonadota bacterium]|nr:RNA-binding cell elongation regulator Jag/EloR [Armatimonadota bacterium]
MTSIEQTGKTVEEATELALKALGVSEDEVDIEILDEGTRGFLGIGQSPARVRVTLKPEARLKETTVEPAQQPPSREEVEAKAVMVPQKEIAGGEEPAGLPPTDAVLLAAEKARNVLQHILDGIGNGARAEIKNTDEQVVLNITGGDVGMLIGKHGQTINAIQYLVGVITNKQLQHKVRIIVDAEGYRSRREEALRNQALFLAKKVKESGQEAVLEALMASERRIIHLALANDPDVYTYSEGEEPNRRVVISPRK